MTVNTDADIATDALSLPDDNVPLATMTLEVHDIVDALHGNRPLPTQVVCSAFLQTQLLSRCV